MYFFKALAKIFLLAWKSCSWQHRKNLLKSMSGKDMGIPSILHELGNKYYHRLGNVWKLVSHIWELCGLLNSIDIYSKPMAWYGNILVFPKIFPQYETLHYPYSVDYLGFIITANFLKNQQPGNNMAFHRIFSFDGNLYIHKHWEFHGFSSTLNPRGSEDYGKSLCFLLLFPYYVNSLFPYFRNCMDFCFTRNI